MNFQELRRLVHRGEGSQLEFKLKANHPEKIMKSFVAFANSQGGTLLLGVRDDKMIKGVKSLKEDEYVMFKAIEEYINPALKYDYYSIPIENSEREVMVFEIPASKKIHYLLPEPHAERGLAYIRMEDKCIKASREMREIMRAAKRNKEVHFQYGDKEQFLMQYLDNNEKITVSEFSEKAKIPRKVASRTLVLLVLAKVLKIIPHEMQDTFMALETV